MRTSRRCRQHRPRHLASREPRPATYLRLPRRPPHGNELRRGDRADHRAGRAVRDRRGGDPRPRAARVQEHAALAARALRRARARAATQTFLVYEDERWSFADVDGAASTRSAPRSSHRYGVAPGDRVAIAMRNYPEWIVAFAAITSVGGVAVSLNAWWTADELDYGAARLRQPTSLIADAERARARVAPLLAQLGAARDRGAHDGRAAGRRRALRGRRARRRAAARGRRSTRHGRDDPLHVGHDGPPEGRRLDAPRGALGARRASRCRAAVRRRCSARRPARRRPVPDQLHPHRAALPRDGLRAR